MNSLRSRLSGLIGLAAVFSIDFLSKTLILTHVRPGVPLELGPGLAFNLSFNTGVTFGLFNDGGDRGRWLLLAATAMISIGLLIWLWRESRAAVAFALGLVVGGAFGNFLDRLRDGAVTDFIDVHGGSIHWPTFNLADAGIVTGVILLLLHGARRSPPQASEANYTPALGRGGIRAYDLCVRVWTRERVWRARLLELLAPRDGETILDVGCGTGTLAILIKQKAPSSRVIGLDPDPQILEVARTKAAAGAEIEFIEGFARDAAAVLGPGGADKAVCSLVFHQTPLSEKERGVAALFEKRPTGRPGDRRRLCPATRLDAAIVPRHPDDRRMGKHAMERARTP